MNFSTFNLFTSFYTKLSPVLKSLKSPLPFVREVEGFWTLFCRHFLLESTQCHFSTLLIVTPDLRQAETLYESLHSCMLNENKEKAVAPSPFIVLIPTQEVGPYSNILSSLGIIDSLFSTLSSLAMTSSNVNANSQKKIFIVPAKGLFFPCPPPSFFQKKTLVLEKESCWEKNLLLEKFSQLGYAASPMIDIPGSFSWRGEILDIYPFGGSPARIRFYDDLVETIYLLNERLGTDLTQEQESLFITPGPKACLSEKAISKFFTEVLSPIASQGGTAREYAKNILGLLKEVRNFDKLPGFISLFYPQKDSLLSYFSPEKTLILDWNTEPREEIEWEFLEEEISLWEKNFLGKLAPSPTSLYFSQEEIKNKKRPFFQISRSFYASVDPFFLQRPLSIPLSRPLEKMELTQKIRFFEKQLIQECGENGSSLHIFSPNPNLSKTFFEIGISFTLPTFFHHSKLQEGFLFPLGQALVLTEKELFERKKTRELSFPSAQTIQKNKTQAREESQIQDLFVSQLKDLKIHDFVIHKIFGLGQYQGLKQMEWGGVFSDYLVLEYQDNDKLYVPVYKMDLIQKFVMTETTPNIASLRQTKFQKLKERARESLKKLAFDLLKLLASRAATKSFAFSPWNEEDEQFAEKFPFEETPDQLMAIERVLRDMSQETPMDHLVCGDVGFGKTEVAMRAAFKAVSDGKQVAVLVPTTILALQHHQSFVQRFEGYPFLIDSLSRLKTPKEEKEILEKISTGKIDILIGTHKLLSSNIKFKDLGLVIVDEEHRFGVTHKEKMKLLKVSVDFLTLTATPIPRTLQLSFIGVKQLSLIKTPPSKRQSIKTYLIQEDFEEIKLVLERELGRLGQAFVIYNRVSDMELFVEKITKLLPSSKVDYIHGQLPPTVIEKKMIQFYQKEFSILVATTLIESGIDVPNANTLIVYRADTFGLAQLHQLRGRIGRSNVQAFAYFLIPPKGITSQSQKRLEALQRYCELGQGVSLASSDLEIRGAGDLLGAEQSGHLEAIGLELYNQLLQEAIAELKGEKIIAFENIEIFIPFAAYIPATYIEAPSLRLGVYKKMASCRDIEELEKAFEELNDLFGHPPVEAQGLKTLLKVKILLAPFCLKTIKAFPPKITFEFSQELLKERPKTQELLADYFLKYKNHFKFGQSFAIEYHLQKPFTLESFESLCKNIALQNDPC